MSRPISHQVFDVFTTHAQEELSAKELSKILKARKVKITQHYLYTVLMRLEDYGVITSYYGQHLRWSTKNTFLGQYYEQKNKKQR
jgi:hypothetical protein